MALVIGLPFSNLDVAHCAMQFKENRAQLVHDTEILYKREYDWITGQYNASERPSAQHILREVATGNGYSFHHYKDSWLSIKKSVMTSGSRRPGGCDNVAWDSFEHEKLNRASVLIAHQGNLSSLPWDKKLAEVAGVRGRLFEKGSALVFYYGPRSVAEQISDTFFGQPFAEAWNELGRWQETDQDEVFVIASNDRDRRISTNYVRALGNSGLFTYTDHSLVETGFKVRLIPDRA